MKIAIDCRSVSGAGKAELSEVAHYVSRLAKHLLALDEENRYLLIFDDSARKERIHDILGSNHKVVVKILPLSRWKRVLPFAYSHRSAAAAITKSGADVTHFPSGHLPTGFKGKSVLTVHDLAIYAHPEWFPAKGFFAKRLVVPAGVERATRIIATSHSNKLELQRLFATPADRISVVYEGVDLKPHQDSVDAGLAIKRLGLAQPYFLSVATLEPRKNVLALVEAFATLHEKFPKLVGRARLVLVGADGWKAEETRARVAELNAGFGKRGPAPYGAGRGPRIDITGFLSEQDKAYAHQRALAFVAPSLDDSCGRAALEAMSYGLPIVASDRGVLPELTARAGIMIDPTRKSELVLAMKHILEDPRGRAEWGRKAFERALEFNWDRAAGETLEVYEKAARTQ